MMRGFPQSRGIRVTAVGIGLMSRRWRRDDNVSTARWAGREAGKTFQGKEVRHALGMCPIRAPSGTAPTTRGAGQWCDLGMRGAGRICRPRGTCRASWGSRPAGPSRLSSPHPRKSGSLALYGDLHHCGLHPERQPDYRSESLCQWLGGGYRPAREVSRAPWDGNVSNYSMRDTQGMCRRRSTRMPDGGAGGVSGGNALRCSLRSANAFPPIQMAESAVVGVTSVMLAKRKRR